MLRFAATVDYNPVIVQLVFPAGSGPLTSLEGILSPIEDNRVEPNENVQLTATITAGTGAFTLNGDTATVVIQDNDCTKFATIITEINYHSCCYYYSPYNRI